MTGIEALQAMDNGKKVRKTFWAKDKYIYWDGVTGYIYSENGIWCESADAFVANFMGGRDEWEIYNEGWQNVEVKSIWNVPTGEIDMALVSAANCPYCNKKIVTLRFLGDYKYCPYCGKQVIK